MENYSNVNFFASKIFNFLEMLRPSGVSFYENNSFVGLWDTYEAAFSVSKNEKCACNGSWQLAFDFLLQSFTKCIEKIKNLTHGTS